jgi:hypothetical protein
MSTTLFGIEARGNPKSPGGTGRGVRIIRVGVPIVVRIIRIVTKSNDYRGRLRWRPLSISPATSSSRRLRWRSARPVPFGRLQSFVLSWPGLVLTKPWCAMRDFIIVAVLCLVAAIVADYVWLDGQYSSKVMHELGLDISSVNRR